MGDTTDPSSSLPLRDWVGSGPGRSINTARTNTPCQEKGTHKIDEHQVKENAAKLLYAILHALDHDDKEIRKEFSTIVAAEIEAVVRDFGLDLDRLRDLGKRHSTILTDQIARDRTLAGLERSHQAFGAALAAMRDECGPGHEPSTDLNANIDGLAVGGGAGACGKPPKTRGGSGRKRERDVHELELHCEEMRTTLKRLKGGDEKTRQQSNYV